MRLRWCLLACCWLAMGCVSRGTYREAVTERDTLRARAEAQGRRIELLEASNESLENERVELAGSVEDLREEQQQLSEKLAQLKRRREELEADLERREAQLSATNQEIEKLSKTYGTLVADLEQEVAAGRIEIQQLREGLLFALPGEVLFAPGSVRLSAEGQRILGEVATQLRRSPHRVEVHGHTDNLPVGAQSRYANNWLLAAARAVAVVEALVSLGIEPQRLAAVSFGEQQAIADNSTPEGRARNRRIEIRLLPEPGTAAAE